MKRKAASLLIVFFLGFCMFLSAQGRDEPVEVKIDSLEATPIGVSLTLRSDNNDVLHMMVGFPEGQSIAFAMRHEKPERPTTHDLFKAFLDRNGWKVQKVLIRDLKDGTFLANLTLERGGETQVYDARPSDAMAIGLRFGAKIYVNPKVFVEERQGEGGQQPKETKPKPKQLTL